MNYDYLFTLSARDKNSGATEGNRKFSFVSVFNRFHNWSSGVLSNLFCSELEIQTPQKPSRTDLSLIELAEICRVNICYDWQGNQ